MQKLNQVLVSTGVESFREIVPIALLSLASSAMLVPVVIFAPVALSFILIPLLYMPLFFGVFHAYHRRTEGKKLSVRRCSTVRARVLGRQWRSVCYAPCWC